MTPVSSATAWRGCGVGEAHPETGPGRGQRCRANRHPRQHRPERHRARPGGQEPTGGRPRRLL